MGKMAQPNPPKMGPSANQFAKLQHTPVSQGVASVQHFEAVGPAALAQSKLTKGSNVFNFHNAEIARDRGRPNALSKETTGTVYGGSIGSD